MSNTSFPFDSLCVPLREQLFYFGARFQNVSIPHHGNTLLPAGVRIVDDVGTCVALSTRLCNHVERTFASTVSGRSSNFLQNEQITIQRIKYINNHRKALAAKFRVLAACSKPFEIPLHNVQVS